MKQILMRTVAVVCAAGMTLHPAVAQLASTQTLPDDQIPTDVSVRAAASLQSLTTINRITSPYTSGEAPSLSKLTGFVAVINNINQVKINLTHTGTPIDCDSLRDTSLRNKCISDGVFETRRKCAYYYGPGNDLAAYQPLNGRPYTDLMPIQNAIQAAADVISSSTDAFAFNLGFFETRSFTGRPAEGAAWKGIYDETCTTVAGTYTHNGSDFAGNWGDRMYFLNNPDKELTAIVIRPNSPIFYATDAQDNEDDILPGDRAFSGVLIREKGTDISRGSGKWPAFVIDKADSVVGRTALGVGPDGRKVKVVVVQSGNGGTNTSVQGASIETVRNMFKKSDYPTVFLLDGSGSSQFATSMTLDNTAGSIAARNRSDCVTTEVKACSWWGDTAQATLLSHYAAQWTPSNGETSSLTDEWVDRRGPAMMVISGPK